MKAQIKALVILFLTVTFSAFAGQPTLNEDEPVVAVYQGFSDDKGFTFVVGEGDAAKELAFAAVEDAILAEVNLKDAALVGSSFEVTFADEDQDGNLELKGLKKVEVVEETKE